MKWFVLLKVMQYMKDSDSKTLYGAQIIDNN